MRNLALMWVLAAVALLSASLYVHSETIDSADADYCIDWKNEKDVRLVLVEKDNDFEIQLTTEKFSKCDSSCLLDVVTKFDFIDGSGKSITFSGEYLTGVGGYGGGRWYGEGAFGVVDWEWVIPPVLQLSSPSVMYPKPEQRYRRENILKDMSLLKDKIFTADMMVSTLRQCKHNLNTTYKFNFRVKITGECECDSIKERRK